MRTLRADSLHSLIVDPLFIRISLVGSPVIEANLRDLWELSRVCGVVKEASSFLISISSGF